MMLTRLFSLKTMESLENGLQLHSGATPLFSMRTILLASSQSCRSIHTDAWCKGALNVNTITCCHRPQFLTFDPNANADVTCEQGFIPWLLQNDATRSFGYFLSLCCNKELNLVKSVKKSHRNYFFE